MEPMTSHPDQGEDLALIRERIVPIILTLSERLDTVESRLADVESRLADVETIITKMITGFKGAAENQQRYKLSESIRSQYGADLEPVMPIYKKLVGEDRDPVTDIVEAIMTLRSQEGYSPEMDADYIKDLVNQILGRFGLDSLRSLIEPAVETAVKDGGPASLEIEVATGGTPVMDQLEELRQAKSRSPKIKL